ncbi:MAG: hypothetical protein WBV84_06610, partial [Nitrososphaeraceae archaeon]
VKMRLIPSVPFTEEELLSKNSTKQMLRKIKDFKNTVSYAILKDLQTKAEKGDMVAITTLNDPYSAADYFRFIMVLAILHRQDTAVKDAEIRNLKGKKIYKVEFYIDDDGTPVILNSVTEPEVKLNKNNFVMLM